ncbi:MAG: aminotransferase class I/II-fold pyridoxal phosphate-dependent enzyme [Candidatus Gastranaerophilales bacterium]|nr:aminotransferase class I/II-fold pyridoxal phosphate-dependent enzyme [Candidatus Gastranaerophilales bacterium]
MKIYAINNTTNNKISQRNNTTKEIKSKQNTVPNYPVGISMLYFTGLIPRAKRLEKSDYLISGYISEIAKARRLHGDKEVVDLSMGNPDLTPPEKSKQALKDKVNDLWSHRYNSPKGEGRFLSTISEWMEHRFGVKVNPRTEIMATSGSSDAIDHIFTAFANPGDKVLVPNPGYSLYDDLITRHDLSKTQFDLKPENGYLPDFKKMPKDAKILILNYPHNPTGSFAPKEVFEEAVKWAKETETLIIHDMDNSEVTHTGVKPVGIMQVDGAKDVAFEIHTMSKAQSMPGLRVAFTVSEQENIDNLLNAKYLSGGSVYVPVQYAAIEALKDKEGYIDKINKTYRSRKNTTIERLNKLGSDAKPTDGTYYLWTKVPPEFTSDEFFKYVLHKSKVAFTPGTVFGTNGEGYVRIVMSADEKALNQCFDKIEKAGIRFDTPKSSLPTQTQKEIEQMANGSYTIEPKSERDFKAYKNTLKKKRQILTERFSKMDKKFERFIPQETNNLPWNILKDEQSVYIQNIQEGKPLFGTIKDISPFSNKSEYRKLSTDIKRQWLKKDYPEADILAPYKSSTFYPDAHYFTLYTDDGRLQALANVEVQKDGILWGRSLNTAPWNQGKDSEIRGCGKAIIARMVSFCLETGNDIMKFATDKPENIKFYKELGMKEDGTRNFNGEIHTVLTFDKESMQSYLNNYQTNLSF